MDDNTVESDPGANLLALTNSLPAPVAQGAFKAISRLIGGMADYPAALLRRASQGIEDGTNARTVVSNAVALAAAQKAVANPDLIDRAMDAYVAKAVRKQNNTEAVAQQAVLALAAPAEPGDAEQPPPPADDWMNVFERYAEDASSEKMQLLWGKVLAGEIRKPAAYSLATLRFLSEADQEIVLLAQKIAQSVIGRFIFKTPEMDAGHWFGDLLRAQEIGLLSGVGGLGLEWSPRISEHGWFAYVGRTHSLRVEGTPGTEFPLAVISVSRIGREVSYLSPPPNEASLFAALANSNFITNPAVTRVLIGKNLAGGQMETTVFWSAPIPPSDPTQ